MGSMSKVFLCNKLAIGVTKLSVAPGNVKFQVRRAITASTGDEYWEKLVCILLTPQEVKGLIAILQEEGKM
jgi:hypothetical protein